MAHYRSIFLAPDWCHVRYHGWQETWLDPDVRLLTRRQGPFTRQLAISAHADANEAARLLMPLARKTGFLIETVIHDIVGHAGLTGQLEDAGFRQLGNDATLLNCATIVIDLSPEEASLLAACNADTRRKLRKAEESGLLFEARSGDDPAMRARFVAAFNRMAAERALQPVDAGIVDRMIAAGHARLFSAGDVGGGLSFLLSYETADTGFFLQGASERDKLNDGAGVLLQWGAMRAFRAAGHRWYDMGGLPSLDSDNGIYRFKRGFGGETVLLGHEMGRSGTGLRIARRLRARTGGKAR